MENKSFEQEILHLIDNYLGVPTHSTCYHYTTMDALNGIILSNPIVGQEVCLRATHSKYLNDQSELENGVCLLTNMLSNTILKEKTTEEIIEMIYKRLGDIFVLSLSLNNNSLPMWNTYANRGMGIAIGFENIKSTSETSLALKCVYKPSAIYDLIDNYMNNQRLKVISTVALLFAPLFLKDNSYEYENEVRYVGSFNHEPIQYRLKNSYLIPYKNIYFAKEQIKSITLGPCQNMRDAESSLRHFLDSKGFEHVKIEKSNIPYRSM